MKMVKVVFLVLFFISCFITSFAQDRTDFYSLLSSGTKEKIKGECDRLKKGGMKSVLQRAYYAVMVMKKSNFEKDAKTKMAVFKEGKGLLEKEIAASPEELELRFLRLIIQEQSPKVLKYNLQLQEDKKIILNKFDKATKDLRVEIEKYAKVSKVLLLNDLK